MSVFSTTKLAVTNFIGDISRIVNENFSNIITHLDYLIKSEDETTHKPNIECGKVSASSAEVQTISLNNITVTYNGSKQTISGERLYEAVQKILNQSSTVSSEKISEQ